MGWWAGVLFPALFCFGENPCSVSFHLQAALGKELDRLWIQFPFESLNPLGQSFGGVIIQNRDGLLEDDRTAVILLIGEMDGRSCHFDSGGNDGFMNMVAVQPLTTESRDQCGMNIENFPLIGRGESVEAHESGQDNQIHRVALKVEIDSLAELKVIGKLLPWENQAGDVGRFGFLDPSDAGPAGKSPINLGIEPSLPDTVDEVLEGASAPRKENR